jgi:hypothetical protein
MTEQEWLKCTELTPLLEFLHGGASDRKLRLFAVACCRHDWAYLKSFGRNTVEVAERFADDDASADELAEAKKVVWVDWTHARIVGSNLRWDQATVLAADENLSANILKFGDSKWQSEGRILNLLKDVFGNPFQPVTVDPAWRTPTVTGLAQAIYDERAFDRMPVLADALEDAGCDHADILNHCRQPGEHVRGCWLVDLILGKK